MKVLLKTLKGTNFEIEVEPEDTVADVKKHIETVHGKDVYPAEQQMLIHEGKILEDNTSLDENRVAENSSIIIMTKQSKVSSGGPSTTSVTPPNQAQSASLPSNTTQLSTTTQTPAPIAASSLESDLDGQAASNIAAFEATIRQVLDITGGSWDRELLVRACHSIPVLTVQKEVQLYKEFENRTVDCMVAFQSATNRRNELAAQLEKLKKKHEILRAEMDEMEKDMKQRRLERLNDEKELKRMRLILEEKAPQVIAWKQELELLKQSHVEEINALRELIRNVDWDNLE